MAGFKGRFLLLIFGSLTFITLMVFYYVLFSSNSTFSSVVSLLRQAQPKDDEITVLYRNNQDRYTRRDDFKNKELSSYHSRYTENIILVGADDAAMEGDGGPTLQMELARRGAAQVSYEMWLFVRYQLKKLRQVYKMGPVDLFNQQEEVVKYTLDNLAEYHSAIDDQLESLAANDGWDVWRKQEARRLQGIIQKRLYALQNPVNCSTTPVLLCNLTNTSGFASGIHDVLWCFVRAYYSQQRMVLVTSSWPYAPGGWETLFRPLSDTCGSEIKRAASIGPGGNGGKARRLLAVLPSDLGPRILRMHSNPLAWWYGQFLFYLMRPNPLLEVFLQSRKKKINFNDTIAGIHVRRTDKIGTEAQAYMLGEYMEYVNDYFTGKEMIHPHPVQRRIYLATDDPSVATECQNSFKEYVCIYNSGGAALASDLRTRYSNASLFEVLADLFMLANTNFLVCTFSSGFCRLAYELMQALHLEDYSDRFVSLDVQHHYYAWVSTPPRIAVYSHKARSSKELSFRKGELFRKKSLYSILSEVTYGKRNSGFRHYVKFSETDKEGLIPTFKTKELHWFVRTGNINVYNSSVEIY